MKKNRECEVLVILKIDPFSPVPRWFHVPTVEQS
jgi:hypothetical protein